MTNNKNHKKVGEYDQEISQSHIADQPRHREEEPSASRACTNDSAHSTGS